MTDVTRTDFKGSIPTPGSSSTGSTFDRTASVQTPGGGAQASASVSADYAKLQEEVAGLKETLAKYVTDAGADAFKTVRDAGQSVASQVSHAASDAMDAGSRMAGTASEQAKSFASDIEVMARKNPLGAMAGALAIGVLIGLIGRGRN